MTQQDCNPICGFFDALWKAVQAHGTPCRYRFISAEIVGRVTVTGEITMVQLSVDMQARLSIAPVDQFGNPALVDGEPTWTLSDPALGTLAPDPGGLSALFVPSGMTGPAQVQVSADADLGSGIVTIGGSADLDLVAGQAASLSVTVVPETRP